MASKSSRDRPTKPALIAASILLLLSFILSIIFHSQFRHPIFILAAFLLHSLPTLLAIAFFNKIRDSMKKLSCYLQPICMLLYAPTYYFMLAARSSPEVSFLVSCVFVVWGMGFELGLGMPNRLYLPQMYFMSCVFFVVVVTARRDSMVWLLLNLIPVFCFGVFYVWVYCCRKDIVVPVEEKVVVAPGVEDEAVVV